jgi:drug/metabolite transporter (DMT)-like permease
MIDKVLVLIGMFFWGANWTSAKVIASILPAPQLVLYRYTFVTLFFLPLLWIKKVSFKIEKKSALLLLISSICMGLYQYLFFQGLKTGLAGSAGILVTTINPIITWVLVSLITKKKLSKKEMLGLFIGGSSAFFFLRIWEFDSQTLLVSGTAHFLAASFFWAFVTVLREYIRVPSLLYTFYLFLPITISLLLILPFPESLVGFGLGKIFWGNMIYLASFGTLYSTSIFFYFTQKNGAKLSSSFIFTVPVFAGLVAMVVLKESLSFSTIVGGVLASISVFLLNKAK